MEENRYQSKIDGAYTNREINSILKECLPPKQASACQEIEPRAI